jgi:hypothetical protein
MLVGALLVGLVILDTTLVTYSRTRGRRPVFTGGRDHLTHRVVDRLGSPQAVAGALAATQLLVCGVTIAAANAGAGWVLLASGICVTFAVVLIWQLERLWSGGLVQASDQPGYESTAQAVIETVREATGAQPEEVHSGQAVG